MSDPLEELFRPKPMPPPPKRRRRRKTEAAIQKEIVAWLREQGCVVAVTDAGIVRKMGLDIPCGIPRGWPDLTVCLPGGKFLGLECKSATGRQSPEQKELQQWFEAIGGIYILAHSLTEAKEKLAPHLHLADA